MNYLQQFQQAADFSIKHGLLSPIQTQELSFSKESIIKICCDILEIQGHTSNTLAFNCPVIHFDLYRILKHHGVLSEVTIGQLIYKGKPVIENFSVQRLLDDLNNTDHNQEINLHCWLTLSDGTILDFTHLAGVDYNENKMKHINDCYICIPRGQSEANNDEFIYQPAIVGYDYLVKVKAFIPPPFI